MNAFNAFVTPEYPVLFSLRSSEPREPWEGYVPPGGPDVPAEVEAVPEGCVGISIALLIKGLPSFLATHVVPREEAGAIVESLESGDARVAVVGITVTLEEEDEAEPSPAAFVNLLCGDGRRIVVARILGQPESHTPEALARYVIKEISRGVQVPDLASSAG